MKKVKLNLSLDERVVQWLKAYAAEKSLTVSELIEGWVRERMEGHEDAYDGDNQKKCVYCGRRFTGYGAICPECKREPSPEERERILQKLGEIRAWLDEMAKKKSMP